MLKRRTFASVCCDVGDLRTVNQDRILVRHGEMAGRQVGLFMVADGCGGLSHGETISHLLADSFRVIWEEALPRFLENAEDPEKELIPALMNWVEQINASAYGFGQQIAQRVGSTLTLLVTIDKAYYILNVGDSRVYLCRGKDMLQLTEDQSLVADLLRNREITPEEAKHFGRKNVLTMCVGCFEKVQIFRTSGKLRKGDIFLLCSDGLHSILGEDQIQKWLPKRLEENSATILRDHIPPGAARDNVSVLLVEIR